MKKKELTFDQAHIKWLKKEIAALKARNLKGKAKTQAYLEFNMRHSMIWGTGFAKAEWNK